MNIYWLKICFCVLTFSIIVSSSSMQKNNPQCHHGIERLFHWCEQSDCRGDCICCSQHACKQICRQAHCNSLYCTTLQPCFQSILLQSAIPYVKSMLSISPVSYQDCSQGRCELIKAVRYKDQVSKTFQSCSDGNCDHLYSEADSTKQFCGNCKRMTCTGDHASKCTQICVLGVCENMYCNAKSCEMICTHDSTCNMTCGPNTESCQQRCSHGSKCSMNCDSKVCKQTND